MTIFTNTSLSTSTHDCVVIHLISGSCDPAGAREDRGRTAGSVDGVRAVGGNHGALRFTRKPTDG